MKGENLKLLNHFTDTTVTGAKFNAQKILYCEMNAPIAKLFGNKQDPSHFFNSSLKQINVLSLKI